MQRYQNLSGKSGVTAYASSEDAILVEFRHGAVYLYTQDAIGAKPLATMQQLARNGRGLGTFISQNVRRDFNRKLK